MRTEWAIIYVFVTASALSSCLRTLCTVSGIGWYMFEPLPQSLKQNSKEILLREMGTEVRATFCLLHYDRGMIRDAL